MNLNTLTYLLQKIGIPIEIADEISVALATIFIFIISWCIYRISKFILLRYIKSVVEKSKNQWDDLLFEKKVFNRLSYLVPLIALYASIPILFSDSESLMVSYIKKGCKISFVIVILLIVDSALNVLLQFYSQFKNAKKRPIKGYIQVAKIIINFVGGILLLSILLGKDPATLLAGLGAMTAVLILVFKDSILGFVAGIQITANDMVKIDDWITFPKYSADGTVIDISLNTVKVQNFNKTITTIPTYSLISESFQNWRGMEESGGRRIKRYINIDLNSVKFCSEELIKKLSHIKLLENFISQKTDEIVKYNVENNMSDDTFINGRSLTNLGLFRKYIEFYLKSNQDISDDMTFLVRQLQPSEKGVPLEIYIFSKIQSWVEYEEIQSDIFEHLFAAVNEFELSVFQNPTGKDFRKIS